MIIVYTGDGKGKTTAALGLAMRAIGHNQKVCIIQFIKSLSFKTGEYKFLTDLGIEIYPTGIGFTSKGDKEEHRKALKKGWNLAKAKINSDYDLIILDEINNVLNIDNFKIDDIITIDSLIEALKNAPKKLNIALTGRGAKTELIDIADLATEMKFIKHPYNQGIEAIKGIEF